MLVSWAPRKETQILCQETKIGLKQTQSQNTHKAFISQEEKQTKTMLGTERRTES
jgi:hypothetical protein